MAAATEVRGDMGAVPGEPAVALAAAMETHGCRDAPPETEVAIVETHSKAMFIADLESRYINVGRG